jgi:transcription elongation GreA/GreB family factor
MNEDAVKELINRKPELKPARSKLEAMEPGAYCMHRSWGFGKIKSYDETDGRLVIDFAGKPAHRMDPAFCATTLDILAPDHVLVRKQTEPAAIEKLIEDKPAELVMELLKQYPNRAATGIEIELMLARVVGEGAFKKWWARARRELARDPRVASPAKKTECYVLRSEPVSQEDEILEEFNTTRSARRRIVLADKLLHATASPGEQQDAQDAADLKASLEDVLRTIADAIRDSKQLTAAERLHGAWVRDDLSRFLGRDVAAHQPSIDSLVAEARDLPDVVEALPSQLQARLLGLVETAHPADWKEIVFNLLKCSKGKFTTDCINFLIEHKCSEELAATLARWQTEQNLRAPVLLWIVKNRNSKRFGKIVSGLIAPRLLSSIFFAIDYEALQTAGTRRIPIAEELSDDPDLVADLLATADAETARDLANSLMLNQGFEELTKKSLLARFIKLFPGIQQLVSGESEEREERLLVSRESFDRKQQELRDLIEKKIPENSRAIAHARELGDLSENAEYKMAKDDQTVLLARRDALQRELHRAQITDFSNTTTEQVGVGSVVVLHDPKTDRAYTFTVLGAWDSIPEQHVISYKSALGGALLGRRLGDLVSARIGDHDEPLVVREIQRHVETSKA